MKLHRWNGERWYEDDRAAVARVAGWVLWPGGWQTFRTWSLKERMKPRHWTPWSLFGHRITCFGWGLQWRVKGGYWLAVWRPGKRIYWSPDGTPDQATVWLYGTPRHVTHAAAEAQREQDERMSRLRSVA
jgi:hypothetical protein